MGSLDFPFLHGHWRSSDCNCRGGSRAVFLRDVIVGHILVGHSGWLVTLPVLKAPGRSSERAPRRLTHVRFRGAKRTMPGEWVMSAADPKRTSRGRKSRSAAALGVLFVSFGKHGSYWAVRQREFIAMLIG